MVDTTKRTNLRRIAANIYESDAFVCNTPCIYNMLEKRMRSRARTPPHTDSDKAKNRGTQNNLRAAVFGV